MAITTTLTVNVQDNERHIINAEVDSRETGYNNGDTSFTSGQNVYFIVHKSPEVEITEVSSSSGAISLIAQDEDISVEEILTFAKEKEKTLSQHLSLLTSIKFLTAPLMYSIEENRVVLEDKYLSVAKINYITKGEIYLLHSLPQQLNGEEDYPVIIYVEGIVQ